MAGCYYIGRFLLLFYFILNVDGWVESGTFNNKFASIIATNDLKAGVELLLETLYISNMLTMNNVQRNIRIANQRWPQTFKESVGLYLGLVRTKNQKQSF